MSDRTDTIIALIAGFIPDYKTLTRLRLVKKSADAIIDKHYRAVRAYPARFYKECPLYIIRIETLMTKCVTNTNVLIMHT